MKRVTGIGGIFFQAKDPVALRAWYQKHLGIDVLDWGGAAFKWTDGAGNAADERGRGDAVDQERHGVVARVDRPAAAGNRGRPDAASASERLAS